MTDAIGSANPASINSVLETMRTIRSQAGLDLSAEIANDRRSAQVHPSNFGTVLGDALSQVNRLQQDAGQLTNAFVEGKHDDLVSVVVAGQKAGLAFQGLNQVRNQVVSAYQDIMNMPI